jgi:hypothetical protein
MILLNTSSSLTLANQTTILVPESVTCCHIALVSRCIENLKLQTHPQVSLLLVILVIKYVFLFSQFSPQMFFFWLDLSLKLIAKEVVGCV